MLRAGWAASLLLIPSAKCMSCVNPETKLSCQSSLVEELLPAVPTKALFWRHRLHLPCRTGGVPRLPLGPSECAQAPEVSLLSRHKAPREWSGVTPGCLVSISSCKHSLQVLVMPPAGFRCPDYRFPGWSRER